MEATTRLSGSAADNMNKDCGLDQICEAQESAVPKDDDASKDGNFADDCDGLDDLNVQFDLPSAGKVRDAVQHEGRVLRKRQLRPQVQRVNIDSDAYRQWRDVGKAQGLQSDAEIASFLLQHYESTKEQSSPTAHCLNCNASLTIPVFCAKCNPPQVPSKHPSKPVKIKTTAGKLLKKPKRTVEKSFKYSRKRRLAKDDSSNTTSICSNLTQTTDKRLDSMMDAVVAENVDEDDFLLMDLSNEVDTKEDSNDLLEHKELKAAVNDEGEKPFACKECDLTYTRACSLKVHMRKHTGEKPFACDECDATFSLSGSLIVHKRTHTGEKPFVCEECGAAFSISSALKQHSRKHTGEKPYKCNVCGSVYSRSDSLKVHMRTHSGYKPFVCEECGATFARLYCLIAHKKKHTGERPFRCSECGATFTQSGKLTIHMRKHTGDRPFQCELCGAAFTQSDRLKTHMRTHTGYKPFKCSECLKCFSHPHSLKVHMRTHTGDKPYKCDVCGLTFADPSYFRRHKAKHISAPPPASAGVTPSTVANSDTFSLIRSAYQCTSVYPM